MWASLGNLIHICSYDQPLPIEECNNVSSCVYEYLLMRQDRKHQKDKVRCMDVWIHSWRFLNVGTSHIVLRMIDWLGLIPYRSILSCKSINACTAYINVFLISRFKACAQVALKAMKTFENWKFIMVTVLSTRLKSRLFKIWRFHNTLSIHFTSMLYMKWTSLAPISKKRGANTKDIFK